MGKRWQTEYPAAGHAPLVGRDNDDTPLQRTVQDLGAQATHTTITVGDLYRDLERPLPFTTDQTTNLDRLVALLADSEDLVVDEVPLPHNQTATLVYCRDIVDPTQLDRAVFSPLSRGEVPYGPERKSITTFGEALDAVLMGRVVIFDPKTRDVLKVDVHRTAKRSVEKPEMEPAILAPQEAFNETLSDNLALLRQWVRDDELQVRYVTVGRRTQTRVAVVFLRDLAQEELVGEVLRRIDAIEIDGVFNSTYVEELISDDPWTPMPLVITTERPDRTAAAIVEGRVAILADRSPVALLAPSTFLDFFSARSDYAFNWAFVSFIRLVRLAAAFVALNLPALYVAVVAFNPEMVPPKLALSIASSRQGIPFPAIVEVLILEFALEILREGTIRMPRNLGQTIGVVGALILGTAAVQAGIVSNIMVIIVATTAIASFVIPDYKLANSVRAVRFLMIVCAMFFGLYGLMLTWAFVLAHLVGLQSFGVPFFSPLGPLSPGDWKDGLLRLPLRVLHRRIDVVDPKNVVRLGKAGPLD